MAKTPSPEAQQDARLREYAELRAAAHVPRLDAERQQAAAEQAAAREELPPPPVPGDV